MANSTFSPTAQTEHSSSVAFGAFCGPNSRAFAPWVPCAFLWLLLPFCFSSLHSQPAQRALPATRIYRAKWVLSAIPVILLAPKFVQHLVVAQKVVAGDLLLPFVAAITMLTAAFLTQWYRLRGLVTSGVLWCYWLLCLVDSSALMCSDIRQAILNSAEDFPWQLVATCTYFMVCLVQFILFCFADVPEDFKRVNKNVCPEHWVSFASLITFHWLSPLVVAGYKKPLEESDLYRLSYRDQLATHFPYFERAWNKAMDAWRKSLLVHNENTSNHLHKHSGDAAANETTSLLSNARKVTKHSCRPKLKERTPSLVAVLCRGYGRLILISLVCKSLYDVLLIVDPYIQSLLIQYAASQNEAAWEGCLLALGLLVSQLVKTLLCQQAFHLCTVAGMQIHSALTSLIYKKTLVMDRESSDDYTEGKIINLICVDAQRIQEALKFVCFLWSGSLQIGMAMWQLYEVIGVSMFAGFALMVLSMPVNCFVASKQRQLQAMQMKLKDERINLTCEALSGIKVLKLYAWEPSFELKIALIRNREMAIIKKNWYYRAAQIFSYTVLPSMMIVITFAVYISLNAGHVLRPEVAFVAMSLFNIMKLPLNQLPNMVSNVVVAGVSIGRVADYLKTPNINKNNVLHSITPATALKIQNGTFKWRINSSPILRSITLEVSKQSLVAIIGHVGCGKSSLLSACIGDMHTVSGQVNVDGRVAYVSQQAWIQNTSIRDNILCGKDYVEAQYSKAIQACALQADFGAFESGDMTLIGEKGINLSGGQKQRVSIARAIYADADIYLLDDPLSAVDVTVGQYIFHHVIGKGGLLSHKTRVLVTHGVQWLPLVDKVIVMTASRIAEVGTYDELLRRKGPFTHYIRTYSTDGQGKNATVGIQGVSTEVLHEPNFALSTWHQKLADQQLLDPALICHRNVSSLAAEATTLACRRQSAAIGAGMVQEPVENGQVKMAVYVWYARALGICSTFAALCLLALSFVAHAVSGIWLSIWTDEVHVHLSNGSDSSYPWQNRQSMYLGIYTALGGMQGFFILLFSIMLAFGQIRTSGILHSQLLHGVMRATMAFFDTKPIGMALNRFSKDIDIIDDLLGLLVCRLLQTLFSVICMLLAMIYSIPIFTILVLFLAIAFYIIQRLFTPTMTQLKRLDSVTRTPIYTHLTETINGASVIRAYGFEDKFVHMAFEKVERNMVASFLASVTERWLSIRLEVLGSFVVFGVAMIAVLSKMWQPAAAASASLVGLSITYALSITSALNALVRCGSDLQTNIVAIERVKEYSEVQREAEWIAAGGYAPSGWPQSGSIEFNGYSASHHPGLGLALKDITLSIHSGTKVGVIGRSGAGKSSMMLSLFRLIEGTSGRIKFDGIDIATVGLHQLRGNLTILPQDPVLFSGTLRCNLDPFNKHPDDHIWAALDQAHLKEFVLAQPSGLHYECGQGGQNLSVGQRQLICLARSLLRKTKVFVLDEVTAAVDIKTEALIQQTIRSAFADSTVITIAHRLNTIMDCDRVLVLDAGAVLEFNSPAALLQDKQSAFYKMAESAGLI